VLAGQPVPVDIEPDEIDPITHKLQEPILMFDELITSHLAQSVAGADAKEALATKLNLSRR